MYLAKNLKILRAIKQIRQKELASVLWVPQKRMGSYEEGRAEPSIETMLKISEYFKVEIKSLVNEDFSQVFKDYMK
jgi:DNA-binding XRE family transcriptional regulator